MPTTPEGVDTEEGTLSRDDAANALLSRWTDAQKPSEDDEGAKPPRRDETTRDTEEDENHESESDDELDLEDEDQDENQDEENDEGDGPVEASDDALVKLTVDGEELQVPVKDLKRLYGQEAALTRKSQEVAHKRQLAEEEGGRYILATKKLLDRAQERFKPYAEIDWEIAAKTLSNEEFIQLRKEAQEAHTEVRFLSEELNATFEGVKKEREQAQVEAARAAVKVLQTEIPNFDGDTYKSIVDYGVSRGLDRDELVQVTDPAALLMIWEAKKYREAKARAATKRKAAPTSKRTMKTNRRPTGKVGERGADEIQKLRKSGKRDDAVAALMARWEKQGDD